MSYVSDNTVPADKIATMFPVKLCFNLVQPGRMLYYFGDGREYSTMVVKVTDDDSLNWRDEIIGKRAWTSSTMGNRSERQSPLSFTEEMDEMYVDLSDVAVQDAACRFICGFFGAPGRPAWLERGGKRTDDSAWMLRTRPNFYGGEAHQDGVEDASFDNIVFMTLHQDDGDRMVILRSSGQFREEVVVMVPGLRRDMSEVEALATILKAIHKAA